MANNQNLKPIKKGELSSEEAKKRGSNGGKKSAKVKKQKKLFKEIFIELLSYDIEKFTTNEELLEKTAETYREFAQNCTEKVLRRMKASNKSMQKHYKRMEMLETITHYIWLVFMPILIVDIILTIGKLLTMYGIIKAL